MQEMQEDEIELIDIVRVLWKRRKLIVLGTLCLTLGAVGIVLLLPRIYDISTIIEPGVRPVVDVNGQIISEAPVVSPETLRETILGGTYNGPIQKKLKLTAKDYPELKVENPKNTTLVKVSVESADPAKATAILNELVNQVRSDIQSQLENEKNKIETEIKLAKINSQAVSEKIKLVERQVSDTSTKIQELEKARQKSMAALSMNAMSALLYSNEIQNQQIYLNDLQEKLKDMETETRTSVVKMENLQLKLGLIKSARVIKPPTLPEEPIKPKKTLIVALAFIFSLMGAIMLAFLLEYLERSGGIAAPAEF